MNTCTHFSRAIVYLVVITFVAGCATTRSLPASDAGYLQTHINVGDKVNILHRSGREIDMIVSDVNTEGLEGDGAFIAYPDIKEVRITSHDQVIMTGFLILVGVVLVYMLATGTDCDTYDITDDCNN